MPVGGRVRCTTLYAPTQMARCYELSRQADWNTVKHSVRDLEVKKAVKSARSPSVQFRLIRCVDLHYAVQGIGDLAGETGLGERTTDLDDDPVLFRRLLRR